MKIGNELSSPPNMVVDVEEGLQSRWPLADRAFPFALSSEILLSIFSPIVKPQALMQNQSVSYIECSTYNTLLVVNTQINTKSLKK